MDTLRYWSRSEEDHSGVLFGPRRISPGTDIGWELPPRMRFRTLTDLRCTLPSACLESLNGGTWPLLFGCHQDAMSALKSVLCAGPVSHLEKHFQYGWLTVCPLGLQLQWMNLFDVTLFWGIVIVCEYLIELRTNDLLERVSVVWTLIICSTSASWFSDSIFLLPCSNTQRVNKALPFALVTDNRGS